jgi:hypothetical protein
MNITLVEGTDLANLVRTLNAASKEGRLHSLRVSQEGTQVKFKVNSGTWTPAVGRDGRG